MHGARILGVSVIRRHPRKPFPLRFDCNFRRVGPPVVGGALFLTFFMDSVRNSRECGGW